MDLLSGYASSDGEEKCDAERMQPRPTASAATLLPDAATLFAATRDCPAGAGQLAVP